MSAPRPPAHLEKPTRAWFRNTVRTYELEEHHVRILIAAGEAWDRAQEARRTIKAEGPFFVDRFGQPKAHPACAVERDSRISFARLVRELDLDGEPEPDHRPPRMR